MPAPYSSSIGSNPSVKGNSSVTTEVSPTTTDTKEFRRNPSEVTMILSKLPSLVVTIVQDSYSLRPIGVFCAMIRV